MLTNMSSKTSGVVATPIVQQTAFCLNLKRLGCTPLAVNFKPNQPTLTMDRLRIFRKLSFPQLTGESDFLGILKPRDNVLHGIRTLWAELEPEESVQGVFLEELRMPSPYLPKECV
jgi:hypothetical protein